MGLLRFSLASFVVLFHVGGWSGFPGRLAVMGFHVVSGCLICRILDVTYRGVGGKLAFIINRMLRLYPLYVALSFTCFFSMVPLGMSR